MEYSFDHHINCDLLLSPLPQRWRSALEHSPPQAEDWVFESHLRQTYVVKAANESSTAKRSANR